MGSLFWKSMCKLTRLTGQTHGERVWSNSIINSCLTQQKFLGTLNDLVINHGTWFHWHFAEEPGILKEVLPFQNMAQLCLHLHCTSLGFNAEYAIQKCDRNLTRLSPPVWGSGLWDYIQLGMVICYQYECCALCWLPAALQLLRPKVNSFL